MVDILKLPSQPSSSFFAHALNQRCKTPSQQITAPIFLSNIKQYPADPQTNTLYPKRWIGRCLGDPPRLLDVAHVPYSLHRKIMYQELSRPILGRTDQQGSNKCRHQPLDISRDSAKIQNAPPGTSGTSQTSLLGIHVQSTRLFDTLIQTHHRQRRISATVEQSDEQYYEHIDDVAKILGIDSCRATQVGRKMSDDFCRIIAVMHLGKERLSQNRFSIVRNFNHRPFLLKLALSFFEIRRQPTVSRRVTAEHLAVHRVVAMLPSFPRRWHPTIHLWHETNRSNTIAIPVISKIPHLQCSRRRSISALQWSHRRYRSQFHWISLVTMTRKKRSPCRKNLFSCRRKRPRISRATVNWLRKWQVPNRKLNRSLLKSINSSCPRPRRRRRRPQLASETDRNRSRRRKQHRRHHHQNAIDTCQLLPTQRSSPINY